MESQRVGHDLATKPQHTIFHRAAPVYFPTNDGVFFFSMCPYSIAILSLENMCVSIGRNASC